MKKEHLWILQCRIQDAMHGLEDASRVVVELLADVLWELDQLIDEEKQKESTE